MAKLPVADAVTAGAMEEEITLEILALCRSVPLALRNKLRMRILLHWTAPEVKGEAETGVVLAMALMVKTGADSLGH